MCGVSTKTLRRRVSEGKLPAYRLGGSTIHVLPADVEALASRVPPAQAPR